MRTVLAAWALAACASAPARESAPTGAPAGATTSARADTLAPGLVPAGYGTLRQEAVSVRLDLRDVVMQAMPLDESVIRLLSPDSYASLRDVVASRRAELDRLAQSHQLRERELWLVRFYGLSQEARFAPRELTITSAGREFRPLEILPLTSAWGEERLQPRETQAALYLFEDGIALDQPLTVSLGAVRDAGSWATIVRTLERERALVRSRAGSVAR
jgi:hypothetical protein